MKTDNKILFLCTGNYYRSRFSEHFFNAQAQRLNWRADSRALAIKQGFNNVGAISPHALKGLKVRGITVPENERLPLQVVEADFKMADKIIALDEYEHRPLMEKHFSQWTNAIEYWMIHDIDQTYPSVALRQLEQELTQLIESLINL
ncbi:MAG TPA: low molecular weight phosphatase family protein [Gammaproteobacteria bacterium]|nr:low molecular weight phosphatase family protein [Gammaproteobacteria bacterium]